MTGSENIRMNSNFNNAAQISSSSRGRSLKNVFKTRRLPASNHTLRDSNNDNNSVGGVSSTSSNITNQTQQTDPPSRGRAQHSARHDMNQPVNNNSMISGFIAFQDDDHHTIDNISFYPTNNNHIHHGDPPVIKTASRSISPQARPTSRSSEKRPSFLSRTFSRSRSRSTSRSRRLRLMDDDDDNDDNISLASMDSTSSMGSNRSSSASSSSNHNQLLVAVTSSRSDAYHAQRALNSTSRLPRKAPSALKTFHELALGVKDAYEAVGATPTRNVDLNSEEYSGLSPQEQEGTVILSDFMGNLNLLLALVDEVASDSKTRGALKDESDFRSLRDVIKKCNKVLDKMLVRRENKYTLFFRLVQPSDKKDIQRLAVWNKKMEKALSSVGGGDDNGQSTNNDSDAQSVSSDVSSSSRGGFFNRSRKNSSDGDMLLTRQGRSLLPTAGKIRARRATPTPQMRDKFRRDPKDPSSSAEDGYATTGKTLDITPGNLAKHLKSMEEDGSSSPAMLNSMGIPAKFSDNNKSSSTSQSSNSTDNKNNGPIMMDSMAPKDELLGVIRGLKMEKSKGGLSDNITVGPEDLKPNWRRKAHIPSSVPKLPVEYIHRHRLMKQVVNALLGTGPRDTDDELPKSCIITSITSRHADKAGNGKTTLAAAAIQTIEVRERFSDGIVWVRLGRAPLSDVDIRRLYEEIIDQLVHKNSGDENDNNGSGGGSMNDSFSPNPREGTTVQSSDSAPVPSLSSSSLSGSSFPGGDLEGLKEEISRMISRKNVLICLDDVWRLDDAKRFIFENLDHSSTPKKGNELKDISELCSYRIMITTRTQGLLGSNNAHEVFVRIFSEHEAIKLLLFSAGRRLHSGKDSPVFNQARVIVKGCGNSPLALRLAGGLLRTSNRNWTLSSPTWTSLLDQCKSSLEEASKIRSFVNSVGRIVDLSFVAVTDIATRASLRRCLVAFAMVFHDHDWLLSGKGIPKSVVRNLFAIVTGAPNFLYKSDDNSHSSWSSSSRYNTEMYSPDTIIDMLEHMNLIHRAGHGAKPRFISKQMITLKSLMNSSLPLDRYTSNDNNRLHVDIIEDEGTADHPSYLIHESIKYIADDISLRSPPSYTPKSDSYTAFNDALEYERERDEKLQSRGWFSNATKYLFSSPRNESEGGTVPYHHFHGLMISALIASNGHESITTTLHRNRKPIINQEGGEKVEKYIAVSLPSHVIHSRLFASASELLCNDEFCFQRVICLGSVEAARRQVEDISFLRREHQKCASESNLEADGDKSPQASTPQSSFEPTFNVDMDLNQIQKDASQSIINAVRKYETKSSDSSSTLNIAICMSTVAEGLLKFHQTKESIVFLQEALEIYRKYGGINRNLARALNALGRAYLKLCDTTSAISMIEESEQIFKNCDCSNHYDSISNSLLRASIYMEHGQFDQAQKKYEDSIASKKCVYGTYAVTTAKLINEYAATLAKNNRMDESLQQYKFAREIYQYLLKSDNNERFLVFKDHADKFTLDTTLTDLNMASIMSKIGNHRGALDAYDKGIRGLRSHISQAKAYNLDAAELFRLTAQKRHLVSALGRVGSLKLKIGDEPGALASYLQLLKEVDENSPKVSRMEKAKAAVKCATIYRQMGKKENNACAVAHLNDALKMYLELYGPNHKDTKAIAASLKQWQRIDAATQ